MGLFASWSLTPHNIGSIARWHQPTQILSPLIPLFPSLTHHLAAPPNRRASRSSTLWAAVICVSKLVAFSGRSDARTLKPSNPQTLEPSNPRSLVTLNPRTLLASARKEDLPPGRAVPLPTGRTRWRFRGDSRIRGLILVRSGHRLGRFALAAPGGWLAGAGAGKFFVGLAGAGGGTGQWVGGRWESVVAGLFRGDLSGY